ncbi:hypothetical protein CEXT_4961 [Caerostris extrusa]|uniref:Uncharacterized protein n=1 Tax=Caerostris extrusa TaxID=172846 RepID=A0AAV4W9W9_CAEEX|nr:hypothetical protein CEXT_4961 [Caerostris extrusa]
MNIFYGFEAELPVERIRVTWSLFSCKIFVIHGKKQQASDSNDSLIATLLECIKAEEDNKYLFLTPECGILISSALSGCSTNYLYDILYNSASHVRWAAKASNPEPAVPVVHDALAMRDARTVGD